MTKTLDYWLTIAAPLFDMTVQEEIGTGRRPLKKYPEIWLTRHDLAEVFESLATSQIPRENWKDVFLRVRDFARDQNRESGMKFSRVRCKTALTGWAKKAVMGELNEAVKLARNSGSSYAAPQNTRPQPKEVQKPIKDETIDQEGIKKLKKLLDEKFPNRGRRGLRKI